MSAIDKVLNSHHYLKLDPFVWEQAMSELAALREKAASVDAAVLAEREACAKLCEELEMKWWGEYKNPGPNRADPYFDAKSDGACEAAAAIRARGDA